MMKNGILTFLFAFCPGAGQMYQGYMKRGLSLITMFCVAFGASTLLEVLYVAMPIVWMYSFFDTFNLPGAAVGNAQGSLLPGDESPETSQINHQIVEFIAFDTHGLKNFPAPPGPAQGLRGGDGQILQPLRTIGRHIDSLTFKNPICPILCPAPPGYAERSIPWTFVSMMYWK